MVFHIMCTIHFITFTGPLDERSHLVREYVEHFECEKCKDFSS